MHLRRRFRPHPLPSSGIPLGARSTGEYRVPPYWKDASFPKSFFQVFWGVKGCGRIIIENEDLRLGPDKVAIYYPGMLHCLEALGEPWHYHWWTMDGPESNAIMSRFGLKPGLYMAGQPPVRLLRELASKIEKPTFEDELECDAIAYRLINLAAARIAPSAHVSSLSRLVRKTIELCRLHWSDNNCNVAFLARLVGVNRSSLSRAFSAEMKMSLCEYLIDMRLGNARVLLRETKMPVSDVARQCGFSDSNYFTRLFGVRTKVKPLAFRNHIETKDTNLFLCDAPPS